MKITDNFKTELTDFIKNNYSKFGFSDCGIAKAQFLETDSLYYSEWLSSGHNADMKYLERNIDKRLNPNLLIDGTKSVISLIVNYYPGNKTKPNSTYKVSKYAYGKDYHFVIERMLNAFKSLIITNFPDINISSFVDSVPLLERSWAIRSGLGCRGKNSFLINKKFGSYCFISELLIDIELNYDKPAIFDYCGTCTKCIDACPTKAIVKPYVIDARRCITYFTNVSKDNIKINFDSTNHQWIYGCDICQDVCPYNKKPLETTLPDFKPDNFILKMDDNDWENLKEDDFNYIFRDSAIGQIKFDKIKSNINKYTNQS